MRNSNSSPPPSREGEREGEIQARDTAGSAGNGVGETVLGREGGEWEGRRGCCTIYRCFNTSAPGASPGNDETSDEGRALAVGLF